MAENNNKIKIESSFYFKRNEISVIYLKMRNHCVWTVTSIETKNIEYPTAVYSESESKRDKAV